jgi:hypothetical protein
VKGRLVWVKKSARRREEGWEGKRIGKGRSVDTRLERVEVRVARSNVAERMRVRRGRGAMLKERMVNPRPGVVWKLWWILRMAVRRARREAGEGMWMYSAIVGGGPPSWRTGRSWVGVARASLMTGQGFRIRSGSKTRRQGLGELIRMEKEGRIEIVGRVKAP